jgi:hypothetical protein
MTGPMEFIVGGDAEAAVVDILKNLTPELSYINPTVSTNLVGYTVGARWIEVTQEGSLEKLLHIDSPRIDVGVYAERRSVSHDMAKISLASIKYQAGRYRANGLFISSCTLEQGLTRVSDKLQESSRYIFSVRLVCVPKEEITPAS